MGPELKISSVSVVINGDFSPTTFQPAWLAARNLLPPAEAENAKIGLIHPQATMFTLDWLNVNIRPHKMALTCTREESLSALRDLSIGILQLFSNIPVSALGINRDVHYEMESFEKWDNFGHKLAPKEEWRNVLDKPGMLSIQIQGQRKDGLKGFINVIVQPSNLVKQGIYIEVNDHYDLMIEKERSAGSDALRLLKNSWEVSLSASRNIVDKMIRI